MTRLATRFAALSRTGRRALVPFVTAGDPRPSVTVDLMRAMVTAGADVLELGMPFSDPMADGPVIQRASLRALEAGMTLPKVLELVAEFRQVDATTPVVLMGYLNPIEVFGYAPFVAAASAAGVDGLLVVDLPPEEGEELHALMQASELDMIYLVSPTTTDERVARICAQASGFIYYISLTGVTGSAHLDTGSVGENVARIKRFTDLPVGVGFGIRDGESAAAIARVADAVIVGAVLVQRVADLVDTPQRIPAGVAELVSDMRRAMDGV